MSTISRLHCQHLSHCLEVVPLENVVENSAAVFWVVLNLFSVFSGSPKYCRHLVGHRALLFLDEFLLLHCTLLRKLDFTPFTLEIETPDVQLLTLKSYYQWLEQLEHIISFFLPFSKSGKKLPKLEIF